MIKEKTYDDEGDEMKNHRSCVDDSEETSEILALI